MLCHTERTFTFAENETRLFRFNHQKCLISDYRFNATTTLCVVIAKKNKRKKNAIIVFCFD